MLSKAAAAKEQERCEGQSWPKSHRLAPWCWLWLRAVRVVEGSREEQQAARGGRLVFRENHMLQLQGAIVDEKVKREKKVAGDNQAAGLRCTRGLLLG
jgi:hypothetical protein